MKAIKGLLIYFRLLFHRKFYSMKRMKKYQLRELKKIYKYSIKHSPYYKELYKGYELESLDDFHKLPTIDKHTMMKHFSTINTCNIDKEEIMEFAVTKENNKDYLGYFKEEYVVGLSSGTSGNKGIYITPKNMTELLPFVFLARSGLSLRLLPFRILFLLRVFSQGFDDINSKLISLNYLSTMEEPKTIVHIINEKNINILMAPPSLLRQLLPFIEDIKVNIKQIITYAEVLNLEDKERFESNFNTKVIEIYQASEGQMASACKYGHLHLNEDLVYIELYDEHGNLITEEDVIGHKMVITNLVNYAQPLIRYEMNDMVVLDKKCKCGSSFRRIKKIFGRHDDLLYFLDSEGNKKYIFPDLFVRWIIVSSENIREFQVVQNSVNDLVITIDLFENDKDILQVLNQKIISELEQFNIVNTNIVFELDRIELPKDKNKYKRFVSNLD